MAYCDWRGQRLPNRDEWIRAGYTELRADPPASFQRGMTYEFPTGNSPEGANCLAECGADLRPIAGKRDYSRYLDRGFGHAPAGQTKAGVNGLFDMGRNVWEWAVMGNGSSQATMGGHGGMVPIRCDQIMAPPSRVIWRLSISGSAASQNDQRPITQNQVPNKPHQANAALTLGHHLKIGKRRHCCVGIEQN
jgi:hypothetical protein